MKTHKINVKKLSNIRDKSFGKIKYKDENIFFHTRFGIHTFGMKNSIIVIVLDKDFKIINIKKVNPNRFYFWNIKYNNILEINGSHNYTISIGDKIELID
jgi:uncharacterized membrane protein (UPF0127 family)